MQPNTGGTIPERKSITGRRIIPINKINRHTWLKVTSQYKNRFISESQFRTFYVDYLLHALKDYGKKLYRECPTYRQGQPTGRVDNCIWLGGKLCMVEVKLDFETLDRNSLTSQYRQYLELDEIHTTVESDAPVINYDLIRHTIISIDHNRIGTYQDQSYQTSRGQQLFVWERSLDEIRSIEDIREMRQAMIETIRKYEEER